MPQGYLSYGVPCCFLHVLNKIKKETLCDL